MSESRRNAWILAAFSALLIGATVWATGSQLRSGGAEEAAIEALMADRIAPENQSPLSAQRLEGPEEGIVDRDLFRPILKPARPEDDPRDARANAATDNAAALWLPPIGGGVMVNPFGAAPQTGAPAPSAPPSVSPSYPPPPAAWSPPPQMPEPRTEAPAQPKAPRLAVTGVTGSGASARVLIEDLDSGKRSWVRPGESAFGARVEGATGRGAVLSRDGKVEVLRIGENKDAPPAVAPAQPAGSAPNEGSAKP